MSYGLLDFVGNVGVVVLIITYLMLQLNKLNSNGLEVFWVLISFVGIYRYFRMKALRSQTLDG